jgi:hypothetical protein
MRIDRRPSSVVRRLGVSASLLLLLTGARVAGQTVVDPSGHWQGTIVVQSMSLLLEIDFAKDKKGALIGTVSMPGQKLLGAPLSDITVDGQTLAFALPVTGSRVTASVDVAAKTMSAQIESRTAGNIAVTLARTGEARIDAPPKSAAISKNVEGTWNGTLEVDGGRRVLLTLSNHPDGTSTGSLVSLDEGRLEMPVAIAQTGANLTLTIKMVDGRYTGAVNSAGTELVGVYTTAQGYDLPLTLKRAEGQPMK